MNAVDWWRHAAIFTGTVGQLGFVGLWLTRTWWKHWVTRAVMTKSFMLLLLLLVTSVRYLIRYSSDSPPWTEAPDVADGWDLAEAILYWLVVVGIWAQFSALIYQVRRDALRPSDIEQAQHDLLRGSEQTPPAAQDDSQ